MNTRGLGCSVSECSGIPREPVEKETQETVNRRSEKEGKGILCRCC